MPRNSGLNTDERNPDGTFAPGNPGKPKGSRHRATQVALNLLEGQTEALAQKAVDMALEGDTVALRLCLERVAPARKDSPVQFDLPAMTNAKEAAGAAQGVLQAVSEGALTPLEATIVMGLVETYRRTLELSEFDGRILALERAIKAGSA